LNNATVQYAIACRGRCIWANFNGSKVIQTTDGFVEYPKQEPYVIPPYS
jgi:hypothetical protein